MVTFTDAHLAQLNALIFEIPHKFAVPIIHFVNAVIAEQQTPTPEKTEGAFSAMPKSSDPI